MDHKYIDQHDVAGRYLRKELPPTERDAFQAHMVDCLECADRVLLAEIFEAEHGADAAQTSAPTAARAEKDVRVPAFLDAHPKLPLRARIVAYLSPWQLAVLFMIFVLGLLAIPSMVLLWEWRHR